MCVWAAGGGGLAEKTRRGLQGVRFFQPDPKAADVPHKSSFPRRKPTS